MKILMSDKERLLTLSMIPGEGSILMLRIIREIKDQLSFSEEELKTMNYVETQLPDGKMRMRWDQGKVLPKEIDFGEAAIVLIRDRLNELDRTKKLTEGHIPLFEKFNQNLK